jgi:hypothetical protein
MRTANRNQAVANQAGAIRRFCCVPASRVRGDGAEGGVARRVRKEGAGGVASRGWKAEPRVDGRPVRADGKEDVIFFSSSFFLVVEIKEQKFRPQQFRELSAAKHITHTLITARRPHSSHRLKHALIQCTTTIKVRRLHHKATLPIRLRAFHPDL